MQAPVLAALQDVNDRNLSRRYRSFSRIQFVHTAGVFMVKPQRLPECDFAAVALVMIDTYGDTAAIEAFQRSAALRLADDSSGANVWHRIGHYIESLQCVA